MGEIVEADGSTSALEFISRHRPSAIVLDLTMTDTGGLELLERVRATPGLERLPVVIHTSKALEADELSRIERDHAIVLDKAGSNARRLLAALHEAGRLGGDG